MRLNDLSIKHLPTGHRYSVWDDTLPSFGIRVNQRTKTYVLKANNAYQPLGRVGIVTLKQARDEARRRLALKYFPSTTLYTNEAINLYLPIKKEENRPATYDTYRTYLARLPNQQLHTLTAQDLYKYLPASKSAANLCFATFRAFLSWCTDRGYIDTNPLREKKRPHKTKSRERLLTDEEIRLIWHESYNHNSFGAIARVLILTGQRLSQIVSLKHEWLSPNEPPTKKNDQILFPAYIMKGNCEHALPLTPAMSSMLTTQLKDQGSSPNDTIFPPFNVQHATNKFRATLPLIPHWTLHDFRRYFSSTCAKLGIPIDITEAILAHTTGSRSQIQRTYDRFDRLAPMRSALETYQEHVLSVVKH